MSKIIIHNNSEKSDKLAIDLVRSVIAQGKTSGENQYCWHTHWNTLKVSVVVRPTRGETYTFKVIDEVMDND
jgi:hypothetical protein